MIFYSNTRPLKKLFKHWQSGLTRNYGCDNVNYLYLGKGIVNNHVRTECQVIVIPRLVKKSVQQANAYHSSVLSVGLIFFFADFLTFHFHVHLILTTDDAMMSYLFSGSVVICVSHSPLAH